MLFANIGDHVLVVVVVNRYIRRSLFVGTLRRNDSITESFHLVTSEGTEHLYVLVCPEELRSQKLNLGLQFFNLFSLWIIVSDRLVGY